MVQPDDEFQPEHPIPMPEATIPLQSFEQKLRELVETQKQQSRVLSDVTRVLKEQQEQEAARQVGSPLFAESF